MASRGHAVLSSVDLDTDASVSGKLEEDYDGGWYGVASGPWSAKGPAISAPPMSLYRSARLHLQWAASGWRDANRWSRALSLVKM